MDDRQVMEAIGSLDDPQERQRLRAQYEREGRSAAFWDALLAAIDLQAARRRDRGTLKGGARWLARKSGNLIGRAVRSLEEQSIRQDEEARRKGQ